MKRLILIITLLCANIAVGQSDSLKIGIDEIMKTGANYYNYSDKNAVNIEVIVIGGVRNPGKYLIPRGLTAVDLLSLSGGALFESSFENIKLLKLRSDSPELQTREIVNLNLRPFFGKEPRTSFEVRNPVLSAGDIMIVPIELERTFWDNVKDVLTVLTPLITIASLIVTITRN